MGVERRVQQSWARAGSVMARLSEMKNKRKEVEVVDLGDDDEEDEFATEVRNTAGLISEKRLKLNNDVDEPPASRRGDDEGSGSGLMEVVSRILEARRRKSTRPLPARIGNQAVDLVALHSRVHSLGGYSKVTDARLWNNISDALGLGHECGPGIKLVFVKYLKALETDSRHSNEITTTSSSRQQLDATTSHPPGAQHHSATRNQNGNKDNETLPDEEVIGDLRQRDYCNNNQPECRQSTTSEDWITAYASVEHLDGIPNPNPNPNPNPSASQSPSASEDWYEGVREENVQQQRGALRGMVEWIKRVAVCPCDPSAAAGLDPGSSGLQDDAWASQCQMLTAKVRSVLWKEPRGSDSLHQAKQMPSLYYDEPVRPDPKTLQKLRATQERLESFGFQPPKSNHQDRNEGSYWGATAGVASYPGQRSGRNAVNNYNESAFARYNQQRKRIPIGPDFQADLPKWDPLHLRTGDTRKDAAGEDDESNEQRWLGVRVWPPVDSTSPSYTPIVGRGRPDSCDCPLPGSLHCVRVHIAAARARLRSKLGPAFVDMGFDQMGECVADQYWSKEEERVFRHVARSHPASKSSNFWDYLPGELPHKTRMELNSYYFNVFMLRRRALQNRLEEVKIDSDDDEGELPGESEESEYGSSDEDEDEDEDDEEEEEEEEDEIFTDSGADADEDVHPDVFPFKVPNEVAVMRKFRPLPDFNYSHAEEVAHSQAQMGLEAAGNHHVAPDDSHVVLVWDDKHLETGSLVRSDDDGSRHWGEQHHPQWDGRDPPVLLGEAVPTSRQASPPKEDVRQGAALGDLWNQSMEMAPKWEKDKLLSTNGMILELFGDDVRH